MDLTMYFKLSNKALVQLLLFLVMGPPNFDSHDALTIQLSEIIQTLRSRSILPTFPKKMTRVLFAELGRGVTEEEIR